MHFSKDSLKNEKQINEHYTYRNTLVGILGSLGWKQVVLKSPKSIKKSFFCTKDYCDQKKSQKDQYEYNNAGNLKKKSEILWTDISTKFI